MSQLAALQEFRSVWLPNTTDAGLSRLAELLRAGSPLLISGSFSQAIPQGCLASHIAWNHPETAKFAEEAGVCWLARVAGLNPATSAVILAWDQAGTFNWGLRQELLAACVAEQDRRAATSVQPAELDELALYAL